MNHRNKKIISYVASVAVIAVAVLWVGAKFIHLGNVEFTDNATIRQQIVPVNSRVQGYIKEIRFEEFEPVRKGDTLVIIDDSDMRLNLARTRADYQFAGYGATSVTCRIHERNLWTPAYDRVGVFAAYSGKLQPYTPVCHIPEMENNPSRHSPFSPHKSRMTGAIQPGMCLLRYIDAERFAPL